MKELKWVGTTKKRLKKFPDLARREAGEQLWRVQTGRDPLDWKPMSEVGPGTKEIRIHKPHEHRVIYVASFPEGVYALHAFEKKTQQTAKQDIEIARENYAEIQKDREKK